MNAGADHTTALANGLQRQRHKRTNDGEDNRGVERFVALLRGVQAFDLARLRDGPLESAP